MNGRLAFAHYDDERISELGGLLAERLLALDGAVLDVSMVTAMRVRSTRDLMLRTRG